MNRAALIIPRSENTRRRKDLFLCTQAVARGLSARDGRLFYPNSKTEPINGGVKQKCSRSQRAASALEHKGDTKTATKSLRRDSRRLTGRRRDSTRSAELFQLEPGTGSLFGERFIVINKRTHARRRRDQFLMRRTRAPPSPPPLTQRATGAGARSAPTHLSRSFLRGGSAVWIAQFNNIYAPAGGRWEHR